MADATVSVVVPVRDGARYLGEALASIARQRVGPLEVVVVDDGSRDASAEVAARFDVRLVRQEPAGATVARNRGIAASSGELVAFLDADDVWPDRSLERRVAALRADPRADLVFGRVREFVSPDLDDAAAAPLRPRDDARPRLIYGAVLVRRRAFDRFGRLPTEWRVGDLMDWVLRARDGGLRELRVDDVVLQRRLHRSNLSRREDRGDHARILKRALDRRRARAE